MGLKMNFGGNFSNLVHNEEPYTAKRVRLKRRQETAPVLLYLLLLIIAQRGCLANTNRPPRFLIDGHSEIVLRLKEGPDTPVGSLIYRVKGSDPDNDPLTFGIKDSGYGSDILRIENKGNNEADIFLIQELDRETKDEYSVILTLTDHRLGDGNFVTQSLLLLVDDVNDNEPIFKPFQSALEVSENSRPGIITTVEATDRDEGAYGQVVYYLQELDGDSDMFSITTAHGKGVIRLVKELDYERKSLYQLRVLAVDRANQGKVNTGTAALLVKVRDVEDQPPEFVSVTPVIRVPEDVPKYSKISQVRAIDGDRGVNNPIKYSIANGFGLFAVNASSGGIHTLRELDRENPENQINGAYIITIKAEEISKTIKNPPYIHTEVTIILNDVNDETPSFKSYFYDCEINENAQINTPVTFLDDSINEVFDHDQGLNGTFDLLLYPLNDIFEVFPNRSVNDANFVIRVKNSQYLDFEKVKEMNFTLVAKEVVPNPKMSQVPLRIQIRDQNDNYPEFTEELYEVSIPENSGIGTTIAQVQAIDEDSGNFGTPGIRYTNMGGSIAHLLHLNQMTGVITIKSPGGSALDRELVTKHYLTIEARDDLGRGNRNTVQLVIHIDDVNDNAPIFLQSKYEAILMENKIAFENQLIVEAKDADLNGTRNSEITYEIVDGEFRRNFTIDSETGVIRPKNSIDFESIKGGSSNVRPIHLTIAAFDGGLPSLTSQVPVTIYVQDVNDHTPVFQKPLYELRIPEDLPSGSPVVEVKAFDGDGSSPNNLIAYRIQRGASDKFVIGSDSGVISIAPGASLDPDLTESHTMHYSLVVLAIDSGIGDHQLSTYTMVNITIIDVNNKPPSFTDPGTLTIKENLQVGTSVFRLIAHDPDSKPELRYKIDPMSSEARSEEGVLIKQSEYDYISAFSLNEEDGLLKVAKIIDREKVEHIKLGFTVEDMAAAKGRQIVSGVLNIIIEDENDNNPKFGKHFYKRSITENSPDGVTIVNVIANDADKNRTISYSLQGPPEILQFLYLDSESGEIVVAKKIDREFMEWLNFTVKATDSGVPTRSSLVEVFVQVMDENDNNPSFIDNLQNLTVSENAEIGSAIATIKARDLDSGEFGKVTFLIDRLSSQGKFAVDPKTGVFSVADKLDRESKDSYMVVIEAWDNYQFGHSTGESRNAFKQLHVKVLDENDSPPVLYLPTSCVQVTEYHELHDPITKIRATDADDPGTENGMMEFQIVGGNEEMLFKVLQTDANNAIIYAKEYLQGKYGNYTLKLSVSDKGVPSNVVFGDLHICVSDYNDHAPVFISPSTNTTIRVPENATVGSTIIQVIARDDDVGPNAAVRYRLKKDPLGNFMMFSIDSISGVLTLRAPLDREKQKIHEIRIEAYDLGTPTALSSDLDLVIYVRNINDYEPQFLVEEILVNFTEHSEPKVEKIKLPDTVDRDEVDDLDDPPTMVCYYIVYGNEMNVFDLDPISHILTVSKELDREEKSNHTLIVKATENCHHHPNSIESYKNEDLLISESRRYETKLKTISSKYVDHRFTHSRSIRNVQNQLDQVRYEIISNLKDGVTEDEILEQDNTLVKIIVMVNDINDNPPVFESKIFTGGVTTETDFGTPFMQVRAFDKDEGSNAKITYYKVGETHKTLTEGLDNVNEEPFLVDQETGFIHLNFDPLKGMKGYFDFIILANDTGGYEDQAHVFIYLLREDQRVRFVLRQQPPEVREKMNIFRETLGNVTKAIINVDEFKIHENKDGSVDKTKTDLYIHVVDRLDNSIMDVGDVLKLIDGNVEKLDDLFKEFNVLDTQPAETMLLTSELKKGQVVIWLIFSNIFIGTLLVIIFSLCLSQRKNYKRQLRAARVNTFSGHNVTDLVNRGASRVPNTNKHSVEGSNPIWLKAYENEWYKNDDNFSQHSGQDSLDENIIVNEQVSNGKTLNKELNTPNTMQRNFNVYHQIDKLANSAHILAKKLETTEL